MPQIIQKTLVLKISDRLQECDWPVEEVIEILYQGADDYHAGRSAQNPGHFIYMEGYRYANNIESFVELVRKNLTPKAA